MADYLSSMRKSGFDPQRVLSSCVFEDPGKEKHHHCFQEKESSLKAACSVLWCLVGSRHMLTFHCRLIKGGHAIA